MVENNFIHLFIVCFFSKLHLLFTVLVRVYPDELINRFDVTKLERRKKRIVLTTLLAIKNKNISDEKLKDIKHDLYDQMMSRKMDKSTRQGLYNFLTYYVGFENQGILTKFHRNTYF